MPALRTTAALSALILTVALTAAADAPDRPRPGEHTEYRRAWFITVDDGTDDEGRPNTYQGVSESALAVATRDGTVTVRDVRTGERRRTILVDPGSPFPLTGVWVTSDTLVALRSDSERSQHTLYAYDLTTGATLWRRTSHTAGGDEDPLVMVNARGIVIVDRSPKDSGMRSIDLRSGAIKAHTVLPERCEFEGAVTDRSMVILSDCAGGLEVAAVDPHTLRRDWARRLPSSYSVGTESPATSVAASPDGYVHAQAGNDGYFLSPDGRLLSTDRTAATPLTGGALRTRPIYVGAYPAYDPPGPLRLDMDWPLPVFLISVDPETGHLDGVPLDLTDRYASSLIGTVSDMAFVRSDSGDIGRIIAYRLVRGGESARWSDACTLLTDRDLQALGGGYSAIPGEQKTLIGSGRTKRADCQFVPADDEHAVISLTVEWVSSSPARARGLFIDEIHNLKRGSTFDPTTESPSLFAYTLDLPGGTLGGTLINVGPVIVRLQSPSRLALRLVAPMVRNNLRARYPAQADASPEGPSGRQIGWSHPADANILAEPLIRDGVLYVGASDGRVYALDAVSGTMRWTTRPGESVENLVLSNGRVFVQTFEGQVVALDAQSGRPRWRARGDGHLAAAAGRVYVGVSRKKADLVVALDASSGAERWRFRTEGSMYYAEPVVAEDTVYVTGGHAVVSDSTVYALDAATGAERWRFQAGDQDDTAELTLRDGIVYVGTSTGMVYALDAASGAIRWTLDAGGGTVPRPVVVDGVAYIGGATVHAVEATSGERMWTAASALEYIPGRYSIISVSQGTVYVGSDTEVVALDAATGRTRWRSRFAVRLESGPTVGAGGVYAGGGDGQVYALDAATGRLRWRYHTGGGVSTTPVVAGDFVYVGCSNGNLYALPLNGR